MQSYVVRTPEQLIPIFSAFRKRHGLSQAELARLIGASSEALRYHLRRPDAPPAITMDLTHSAEDRIMRVRRYSDVHADWLRARNVGKYVPGKRGRPPLGAKLPEV